jgi:hypothetical protein
MSDVLRGCVAVVARKSPIARNEEVAMAVREYLPIQVPDLCSNGYFKLAREWGGGISVSCECVKNGDTLVEQWVGIAQSV